MRCCQHVTHRSRLIIYKSYDDTWFVSPVRIVIFSKGQLTFYLVVIGHLKICC